MAIGNIGIGKTSALATLNVDRLLIIGDKELYLIGASLKDLGAKCFAFTKLAPRRHPLYPEVRVCDGKERRR